MSISDSDVLEAPRSLHYAWIIVAAGAVAIFCGLGLARFAFGMMLPSMSASLSLDHAQSGLLGFAYLIGYLATVAAVPLLAPKLGARVLISGALILVALAMLGVALTENVWALWILFLLTGVGSGGVVVPVMSQASLWFYPSHRGAAAGLLMAGAGLSIVFSGFVVPRLVAASGFLSWQTGWLIFAAATMFAAVLAYGFIRNHPSDIGAVPFGRTPVLQPAGVAARAPVYAFPLVAQLGLIFAIYGAIYMLYVTFIVTSMVESYGLSEAEAGSLWSWFGFLSLFSGILFGALSDRFGRRAGLGVAFAFLAFAFLFVALSPWMLGLYASIVLFGLAAVSVPVIVAASAGDYFGPAKAAHALAILVLIFSAGQAVGPVAAGFLAEWTGDFSSSYGASGAAALFAILLVFMLNVPRTSE